MPFQVGTPVYNTEKRCHELTIQDGPRFEGTLTYPFHIDFDVNAATLNEFVMEFLGKASPYFSKPLDTALFFQRVTHSYSAEDLSGVSIKSLYWIPAKVMFYPSLYQIQWDLIEFEQGEGNLSGNELIETDILPSDKPKSVKILSESEQKRIRQKIRQARLKCALSRLHVERLIEKYYNRYGNFDGFSDGDSELSSDLEFPQNERPRKI